MKTPGEPRELSLNSACRAEEEGAFRGKKPWDSMPDEGVGESRCPPPSALGSQDQGAATEVFGSEPRPSALG